MWMCGCFKGVGFSCMASCFGMPSLIPSLKLKMVDLEDVWKTTPSVLEWPMKTEAFFTQ